MNPSAVLPEMVCQVTSSGNVVIGSDANGSPERGPVFIDLQATGPGPLKKPVASFLKIGTDPMDGFRGDDRGDV